MGFFKNPLKKLKKVAKIAKKIDPIGSKIAAASSPAIKKIMAEDKGKRLYSSPEAVVDSTRRRTPGSDEMER